MTRLFGISGSLRAASLNTKLVHEAARHFRADEFALGNLRLPLYDGDLESTGLPAEVQQLSDQIAAADAVVIATPEYNKNISGVLKNALDWVSRTAGNPWERKPVAIMSATAGRAGGEMAQNSLRQCLQPFRPFILQGPSVFVGGASKEFGDDGRLLSESYETALGKLMAELRALL